MTFNRLLTTAVQIVFLIPTLIMGRIAWEMLKEDVREITK